MLIVSSMPLWGMEASSDSSSSSVVASYAPAARQPYPEGMGFIAEEEFAALCKAPSKETAEQIEALLAKHPNAKKLFSLPAIHSHVIWGQKVEGLPENLSQHNSVFSCNPDDPKSPVIKIAGFYNALRSAVSSIGYDPYNTRSHLPDTALKAIASSTPRFQHMSTLATMELLRRAKSETVVPVNTWAYHLPGTEDTVCDQNYMVVQERLPEEYKQFSTLDSREKRDVLAHLDLEELYRVLKYANLWMPSEENLWVNSTKKGELAYPDGEKPNNEGAGSKARWNIAIFGQDLGKAKHNIRNEWDGGHRIVEGILKNHCPDRLEEWMAYYKSDGELK